MNNSIEFAVRYLWGCYKEGKNLTLCHGDAHAWNAFYPRDSINGKLYFSDWQSVSVNKGISDLAYFMGDSLVSRAKKETGESASTKIPLNIRRIWNYRLFLGRLL